MRACLSSADTCAKGEAGGAKFSEWQNITAQELEGAKYNIFSNRESKQSRAIHGRVWSAANQLSGKQSAMAQANHIQGEAVFGVDLDSPEAAKKFKAGELNTLKNYERLEDVAVGFASLKAHEMWGNEATLVEVRLRRDAVVPFEQRKNPPSETSSTFVKIGWRDVTTFDEDTMAAWK